MRLSYAYVFLFFALVIACAALLFPTDLDVVTLYRNSYLYPEAMDLLDQLTERVPDDARVALEQARVLYLVGRYERSTSILENLSQVTPDNPAVWRMLGQNYRTVQEHERALGAYEELLAQAPADSESLYLLEDYYRWFQQPAKRVVNLEVLLTNFPQDLHSLALLLYASLQLMAAGGALGSCLSFAMAVLQLIEDVSSGGIGTRQEVTQQAADIVAG